MARKQRFNADYFPFFCKEGNTSKYIDNTYGNDGLAIWLRILRLLTITDHHYLDVSSRKTFMTLVSTCKVSEEVLMSIINDLVEFGKFDADLWKRRVIWSEQLTESLRDAYSKRANSVAGKEEVIQLLSGVSGAGNGVSSSFKGPVIPKVKKSKEEKSKVDSGAQNQDEIFELMFADERWAIPFRKNFEGKNIPEGWRECYLYHTQSPNPPTTTWEWRQKLNTWMINKKTDQHQYNGQPTSTNKHQQHTASLVKGFAETYGAVLTGGPTGQSQ
jgi:hypothetical protein